MNDMPKFPAIKVTKKSGGEKFQSNGKFLPFDLLSFWRWSSSDLVSNTLRGILAEFIVASAVGSEGGTRIEWDAYDIKSPEGVKIEVKSAAYIQTWSQKKLSSIQFDIRPTQGWDTATNTSSSKKMRQSDVYVFCVLAHKNKETIDPINLDQWEFFVIATKTLNQLVGDKESIALSSLLKLNPLKVNFHEIDDTLK